MVEIGSIIRARVARIEPYGIYLSHDEETVLVLIPEVSWLPIRDLHEIIHVGEELEVLTIRYNYKTHVIVGSLKRLHPEQNPYRELSRLEPGAVLRGRITFADSVDVTVDLPNHARGTIPRRLMKGDWKIGEEIPVTIQALEVDEGSLLLEQALSKETKPLSSMAG